MKPTRWQRGSTGRSILVRRESWASTPRSPSHTLRWPIGWSSMKARAGE